MSPNNIEQIKRNENIISEAIKGEKNYREIGLEQEPPITKQRVQAILKKFKVSVPMNKRFKKTLYWKMKLKEKYAKKNNNT